MLEAECAERKEPRKQRLVRDASFPRPKRLEDFDFEENPKVTPEIVGRLRDAGANEQVTSLAARAATHASLGNPSAVIRLLDSLHGGGADEETAVLAPGLPAAGLFSEFVQINNAEERFRFGREPDGQAAAMWTWEDLN
ncbi:hypothetical protein ACFXKC_51795 [Streptomyces sp. NPDC059340]|uniref:hypothetical protein n=1 Tax=Streptomyces sp. NPDC059340 TaxID=3346806 RepID=UPI00368C2230